jgi:branched-chain amino acid transport system ATP-binding protein
MRTDRRLFGCGAAEVGPPGAGEALQEAETVAVMSEGGSRPEDGGRKTQDGKLLEVSDIHLSFKGVRAIDGVSFHVDERELFAIIGPNGAGKTSIFNCLNQVYRPQQGEILWKGRSIIGLKPNKTAELGIARTFQNIALFPHMTVIENILTGRHMRMKQGWLAGAFWWGPAKREEMINRHRVEDIIDFLEIEQWRKYPVGLLPYGIQKRVELGRALAMDPELLLLDEPVAGMNLEETEDMARFILDIQDELGITIILVEHDMGLVMDIADRVMVVDFGKKIAEGVPAEIQRNPEVIRAYLGEDFQSKELEAAAAEASAVGEPAT